MISALIRIVLLGIEIEVFIFLLILIGENIIKQNKKNRYGSKSLVRKKGVCYKKTTSNPTVGTVQMGHHSHSLTESSEQTSALEATSTPSIPHISPDTLSEGAVRSPFAHPGDTRSEMFEVSIEKEIICSIKDIQDVNSYSSRVQLVEKEQGELIVTILDDGSILAMPFVEIATERILNDVFSPFFDFSKPEHPHTKKFRIICENAAELIQDSQAFSLKTKGVLKVETA